ELVREQKIAVLAKDRVDQRHGVGHAVAEARRRRAAAAHLVQHFDAELESRVRQHRQVICDQLAVRKDLMRSSEIGNECGCLEWAEQSKYPGERSGTFRRQANHVERRRVGREQQPAGGRLAKERIVAAYVDSEIAEQRGGAARLHAKLSVGCSVAAAHDREPRVERERQVRAGERAVFRLERRRWPITQRTAATIVGERIDARVERAIWIARCWTIRAGHLRGLDRCVVDGARGVRCIARQIARDDAPFPRRPPPKPAEIAPRLAEQPRDLALRVRARAYYKSVDQPRGCELVDVSIDAGVRRNARCRLRGEHRAAEQQQAGGVRADARYPLTATRARDTSDACRRSHHGARPLAESRAIAWLARWNRSSTELR